MNSKRAIVGSFTVMWVSTIAVIIILGIFILSSGFIKKVSNADSGVSILGEEKVGLDDVEGYFDNYVKFRNVTSFIARGENLDVAIREVKYEE